MNTTLQVYSLLFCCLIAVKLDAAKNKAPKQECKQTSPSNSSITTAPVGVNNSFKLKSISPFGSSKKQNLDQNRFLRNSLTTFPKIDPSVFQSVCKEPNQSLLPSLLPSEKRQFELTSGSEALPIEDSKTVLNKDPEVGQLLSSSLIQPLQPVNELPQSPIGHLPPTIGRTPSLIGPLPLPGPPLSSMGRPSMVGQPPLPMKPLTPMIRKALPPIVEPSPPLTGPLPLYRPPLSSMGRPSIVGPSPSSLELLPSMNKQPSPPLTGPLPLSGPPLSSMGRPSMVGPSPSSLELLPPMNRQPSSPPGPLPMVGPPPSPMGSLSPMGLPPIARPPRSPMEPLLLARPPLSSMRPLMGGPSPSSVGLLPPMNKQPPSPMGSLPMVGLPHLPMQFPPLARPPPSPLGPPPVVGPPPSPIEPVPLVEPSLQMGFVQSIIEPTPLAPPLPPPPALESMLPMTGPVPLGPVSTRGQIFSWPYFQGVKRLAFATLCSGRHIATLGRCSSIYLRCGLYGSQYSLEECPAGQVFYDGICQLPVTECSYMRMYRLNIETQYLMQDTHFCMQGEGVYVASLNLCSRQAVICKDYNHGFGISCTHDLVLSSTTLECVPGLPACSSWTISPSEFAPWKFFLVNFYCQTASLGKYMFSRLNYHEQYCRNWYIDCRSSVREIITCDQGYLYDYQSHRCRALTAQDPCFLPPVSCSGRDWYNVGLGECLGNFARCEGGIARRYFCNEGMVFFEGACVQPLLTRGKCSICKNGETAHVLYGLYDQYSVCENGVWVRRFCSYGHAYSQAKGSCIPKYLVTRAFNSCEGGIRLPISCNEYMECSWDGHYYKKTCPLFHSWSVERQQCIFDTNCGTETMPGCTDGQIIESWDCHYYFQCRNRHWLRHPCTDGLNIRGCQRCFNGLYQQQTGVRMECIEGSTRHDYRNCVYYGRCVNGRWRREQCLNGLRWNEHLRQCAPSGDCPYYRRANCLEMERIAYFDRSLCNKYFECSQGAWSLYQCPTGHIFDPRVNQCFRSAAGCAELGPVSSLPIIRFSVVPPPKIGPISYYPTQPNGASAVSCELGSFLADDFDCTRYYTCTKTGLIPSACIPGMGFNPVTNQCESTYRCDTIRCIDGQTRPGRVCGEYRRCVTGSWILKKCPNNQYFAAGKCHPSFGHCGMLPYSTCYNGQALPIEADCSSYLVCQDSLFQRRHCQSGAFFDPTARYCSSSYKCPFCVPGEMRPYEKDCSAYMMCINGHFEQRSCSAHQHFDEKKLECLPGDCLMQLDQIGSCLESPGPLGYRPHPLVKTLFLQCAHGKWVSKACPSGLFWNQAKLVCDWPRNVL